ncbi:MAG: GIN domain-containing protein [Bacteroidota bacterium]|uniref:Putative auto-transporter adhesin, head GIN domain n=1 Tax=Algoriphagus faecimaris TaxID=686796 RepID=A0A1G6Y208_9BACT|nr:head GIN domain-containing protein [Algoriphagus faecimaris]SDD84534.1 Putative auto-transporter adhesin, head GIN domain [Algoriphagus faecimaris]
MNRIKTTAIVLLLFLLGYTAQAQGTETRTPGAFNKIESGGSWEVYVAIGSKDEVRIESGNIDLDKVITEVDGRTLKLKLERGNYRNVDLKFYVTVRTLEGLGSSGSGAIFLDDDVETDRLSLAVSGSGLIRMKKVYAYNLNVGISGSGDIIVDGGAVEELKVGQSGSGDFEAIRLVAQEVSVAKSGSGDSHLTAEKSLKVASSGSGDVIYRGDPVKKSIAMTGSSKLIKD